MKPRTLYALLGVVGTVLPYSQLFGRDSTNAGSLLHQLFGGPYSAMFVMDVLVSAVALAAFMRLESRRYGLRYRWVAVVALLTVGVSLALPLFLFMREPHLEDAAPRTAASPSTYKPL